MPAHGCGDGYSLQGISLRLRVKAVSGQEAFTSLFDINTTSVLFPPFVSKFKVLFNNPKLSPLQKWDDFKKDASFLKNKGRYFVSEDIPELEKFLDSVCSSNSNTNCEFIEQLLRDLILAPFPHFNKPIKALIRGFLVKNLGKLNESNPILRELTTLAFMQLFNMEPVLPALSIIFDAKLKVLFINALLQLKPEVLPKEQLWFRYAYRNIAEMNKDDKDISDAFLTFIMPHISFYNLREIYFTPALRPSEAMILKIFNSIMYKLSFHFSQNLMDMNENQLHAYMYESLSSKSVDENEPGWQQALCREALKKFPLTTPQKQFEFFNHLLDSDEDLSQPLNFTLCSLQAGGNKAEICLLVFNSINSSLEVVHLSKYPFNDENVSYKLSRELMSQNPFIPAWIIKSMPQVERVAEVVSRQIRIMLQSQELERLKVRLTPTQLFQIENMFFQMMTKPPLSLKEYKVDYSVKQELLAAMDPMPHLPMSTFFNEVSQCLTMGTNLDVLLGRHVANETISVSFTSDEDPTNFSVPDFLSHPLPPYRSHYILHCNKDGIYRLFLYNNTFPNNNTKELIEVPVRILKNDRGQQDCKSLHKLMNGGSYIQFKGENLNTLLARSSVFNSIITIDDLIAVEKFLHPLFSNLLDFLNKAQDLVEPIRLPLKRLFDRLMQDDAFKDLENPEEHIAKILAYFFVQMASDDGLGIHDNKVNESALLFRALGVICIAQALQFYGDRLITAELSHLDESEVLLNQGTIATLKNNIVKLKALCLQLAAGTGPDSCARKISMDLLEIFGEREIYQ